MNQDTFLFNLQIVNTIVQIASLIFLIIYVIKTWEMASATRKAAEATERSVAEMKETRDQETAPYIVSYFDLPPGGPRLIYLVVKNIGHSVAERIKITFTPDLQTSMNTSLANISFIRDGIESMPPGYEIRTIIDGALSYFGKTYLPLKYKVKISYFGGIQTSERIYEQTLDLSAHKGLMFTNQKDLGDLVEEVKGLHRELRDAQEAMSNIASVLKSGILINNSSFAITTALVHESLDKGGVSR